MYDYVLFVTHSLLNRTFHAFLVRQGLLVCLIHCRYHCIYCPYDRSILDFWQRFVGSGRYLHEVLKYGHEMRSDLQSVSSSGSSAHNRTTNSTNINKKPSNSTPTTSPKPGKKGKNNNNNNNNKKKKASAGIYLTLFVML